MKFFTSISLALIPSLLPLPVYFDLYTLSILQVDPFLLYQGAVGGLTLFPFPFSLLLLLLFLFFICVTPFKIFPVIQISFPFFSLIRHPSYLIIFIFIIVSSRFQILLFFKSIQLLAPFVLIPFFPILRINNGVRTTILNSYLLSVTIFCIIHILSFFFYATYLESDELIRYASVWGFTLYAAHVSWSSFLGFLLSALYVAFTSSFIKSSVFLFCSIPILLDLLLSGRRDPLFAILAFFFVVAISRLVSAIFSLRFSKSFLLFSILFLLCSFVFPVSLFSGQLNRFTDLTDRIEIWNSLFAFNLQSFDFLFFGNFRPINNLHNYFLSLFASFGFSLFLTVLFLVSSFIRIFFRLVSQSKSQNFDCHAWDMLPFLLIPFFVTNFVNVSITQPFYLVNILFLLLILFPFPLLASNHKSTSS